MSLDSPYSDQQQFPTLGFNGWTGEAPGAQIPQEWSGNNYDYGGSSSSSPTQTGYGNTYDNTGYGTNGPQVATDPYFQDQQQYGNIGNGDTSFQNSNFGSQLGQGLGQFGQWALGGGANNALGALPLASMAAQQFNDARRYENIGRDAQQAADPFGSQRGQYQTMLSNIYNDPAKVLADPQHQAIMNSQLDAIQARNRAGGYMGGGKDFTDMSNYAAQENAKYLNDEKARLAQLSGAQFDPANGAQMMMQGAQLGMNAQNGALGALGMMYQNALGAPQGTQGRPGMGGQQGGGQQGGIPQGVQQAIQQGGTAAQQAYQWMAKNGLGKFMPNGTFMPNANVPGMTANPGYASGQTPYTSGGSEQEIQGGPGRGYSDPYADNPLYQGGQDGYNGPGYGDYQPDAYNMGPNFDQFDNMGSPMQDWNFNIGQDAYDIGSANFDPFAWDLG